MGIASDKGSLDKVKAALELASRIKDADPTEFSAVNRSFHASHRDQDVKDLYLLRQEFSSREAVKSLEKLLVLIYDRTYFEEEPVDSKFFRMTLEDFKSQIDPQVSSWKSMLGK